MLADLVPGNKMPTTSSSTSWTSGSRKAPTKSWKMAPEGKALEVEKETEGMGKMNGGGGLCRAP